MVDKSESDNLIAALERRVWNAVVANDGTALAEKFSDDYVEITLEGRRITKTDVVSGSPNVDQIDAYAIDSEKVIWLDKRLAILSYHLTLDGRCRGVAILPRDRWVTSIWRQMVDKEDWKCCHFQQSPFAPSVSLPEAESMEPTQMVAADCEDVISFWQDMPGVGLGQAESADKLAAYLQRNHGLSLVIRHDQKVVAAVMCGHDGRRGYLYHLAVRPEYRLRGIGQLLVDRCLANLGAVGIQKCNIVVFDDNEEGHGFWQRCGWVERDDLRIMQRATRT